MQQKLWCDFLLATLGICLTSVFVFWLGGASGDTLTFLATLAVSLPITVFIFIQWPHSSSAKKILRDTATVPSNLDFLLLWLVIERKSMIDRRNKC